MKKQIISTSLNESTYSKKDKVKSLVIGMLEQSYEAMLEKVDKVIDSDAIDIDGWDDTMNPMFLPKAIIAAILHNESAQYEGRGTSFEKEIKKEVRNIRYFI
jgi:hypothetical protein